MSVGVDVGVNVPVSVGIAVGVSVGVAGGVFVGVGMTVGVRVGVYVFVGNASTMVLVGVGVAGAGRTGTAMMDHDRVLPKVHDMVVDVAPGSVLPAPSTLLGPVPVLVLYCSVCPDPADSDVALPFAVTASTTSSPELLATVTVAG